MHGPIAILLLLLSLVGAAAEEHGEQKEAPDDEGAARDCMHTDRGRDFDVVDKHHVEVDLLGGQRYRLTLREDCRRLEEAATMRFVSSSSWICANNRSRIFFEDWTGRDHSCRVVGVEELEARDDEEDESPDETPSDD